MAFRPTLTDGLALSENETYLLRLGNSCQPESKPILFNRTEYRGFCRANQKNNDTNCILEIPLTLTDSRILTQIDRIAG